MREIQNTSQSFIREMERAADIQDAAEAKPGEPAAYDPAPYDAAAYEAEPYDDAPTVAMHAVEPPAPDAQPAGGVGEKLAEPGPGLKLIFGEPLRPAGPAVNGAPKRSPAAQPPPQGDHPPDL